MENPFMSSECKVSLPGGDRRWKGNFSVNLLNPTKRFLKFQLSFLQCSVFRNTCFFSPKEPCFPQSEDIMALFVLGRKWTPKKAISYVSVRKDIQKNRLVHDPQAQELYLFTACRCVNQSAECDTSDLFRQALRFHFCLWSQFSSCRLMLQRFQFVRSSSIKRD